MMGRWGKYRQHVCGWPHDAGERCPTPLEMLEMARADYAEERAEALGQGMAEDDFIAGAIRRAEARLAELEGAGE